MVADDVAVYSKRKLGRIIFFDEVQFVRTEMFQRGGEIEFRLFSVAFEEPFGMKFSVRVIDADGTVELFRTEAPGK